jgi:4-amino-4-deoxy-L-arabinose transferase-like glycosyltransferase
MNRRALGLALLVLLAFAARLAYAFAQDAAAVYVGGSGDSAWYLANGYALLIGAEPGARINGIVTDVSQLAQPPLYFLLLGAAQAVTAPGSAAAIHLIWLVQAALGALTVLFGDVLAHTLARAAWPGNAHRPVAAGWLAAVGLAFAPAFVIEPAQVLTETMYLFFVTGGLAAFTLAVARARGPHTPAAVLVPLVLAADAFGLAALTRSVVIAFPLVLAVYWALAVPRRRVWALAFAASMLVWPLLWTATLYAATGRLVFGGSGLGGIVYAGATGWDDPSDIDARLDAEAADAPTAAAPRDTAFLNAAGSSIAADPPGYLVRRARELGEALLQPHGTVAFPGESLRALIMNWLANDGSLAGLRAISETAGFWPKLALYLFHYLALLAGGAALLWLLARRAARVVALPAALWLAYVLAVHAVLLALPRYLFPLLPVLWCAASVLLAVGQRVSARR